MISQENVKIANQKIDEFLSRVGMLHLRPELPLHVCTQDIAAAYTNTQGIWISDDIIRNAPQEIDVYFAHEVFHHVIDTHEVFGYDPSFMNIVLDLKINWLLLKLFGYDIKKTYIKGLFNKKLGPLPIKDIVEALAKKNNYASSSACGPIGSPNPAIKKLAEAIRNKYGLNEYSTKRENIIYTDMFDDEIYEQSGLPENVADAIPYNSILTRTGLTVNMDLLARSLFAIAYNEKPVNVKTVFDKMTVEEILTFGFTPRRYLGISTIGDVKRSVTAVMFYIMNIFTEQDKIMAEIEKTKAQLSRSKYARQSALMSLEKMTKNAAYDRDANPPPPSEASDSQIIHHATKVAEFENSKEWKEKLKRYHSETKKIRNSEKKLHRLTNRTPVIKQIADNIDKINIQPIKLSSAVSYKEARKARLRANLPEINDKKIRRLLMLMCIRQEKMAKVQNILERMKELNNTIGNPEGKNNQDPNKNGEGQSEGEKSLEDIFGRPGQSDPEDDGDQYDSGRSSGLDTDDEDEDYDDDDAPRSKPRSGGQRAGKQNTNHYTRIVSIYERLELYDKIIMHMNEFDSLFANKVQNRADENRIDIENALVFGSDITRLLSSEYALMASKELELLFYSKLANSSLLQHSARENKREAVTVMIDCSGSMYNVYAVAAGFALALLKKVVPQGRGFAIIIFDTKVQKKMIIDPKIGMMADINLLVDTITHFTGGGTSFDDALEGAIEVSEETAWDGNTGILVSDGQDQITRVESIKARAKASKTSFQACITERGQKKGVKESGLFTDIYTIEKNTATNIVSLARAGISVI